VGSSTIPNLPFVVMVPRALVEVAQRALAEAKQAGPQAALEAEQATEAGTI